MQMTELQHQQLNTSQELVSVIKQQVALELQTVNEYNYYFNTLTKTEDTYCNGIMMNVNKINYYVTTYIPIDKNIRNNTLKINNDIKMDIPNEQITADFYVNMTAIKMNNSIKDIEIFAYKTIKKNLTNLKNINVITNKKENIGIKELKYCLHETCPILPKLIMITAKLIDNTNDINIYTGNVVMCENKLIGVISHMETETDATEVIIYIIPGYMIYKWLSSKQNKLTFIHPTITNRMLKDKNIFELNIIDVIGNKKSKINNWKNGYITDNQMGTFQIPFETYLLYNRYDTTNHKLELCSLQESREITEHIDFKTSDDLAIDIYHNRRNIQQVKYETNKIGYINNISLEMLDYLIRNNIYVMNENIVKFDIFSGDKINTTILTNYNDTIETPILTPLETMTPVQFHSITHIGTIKIKSIETIKKCLEENKEQQLIVNNETVHIMI